MRQLAETLLARVALPAVQCGLPPSERRDENQDKRAITLQLLTFLSQYQSRVRIWTQACSQITLASKAFFFNGLKDPLCQPQPGRALIDAIMLLGFRILARRPAAVDPFTRPAKALKHRLEL